MMKVVRMVKSPYLVIGCLLLLILWLLSHPSCAPFSSRRISETRFAYTQPDSSDLSSILRRARMDDRTVVITMVNREWAKPGSLLDLFLESLRIGERTRHFLDHLIVVALDDQALQYCYNVHPHCFLLRGSRRKSEAGEHSTTPDGMAAAWRKKALLKEILELGYNLIFTVSSLANLTTTAATLSFLSLPLSATYVILLQEADVLWLRNPVTHLNSEHEFTVACSSSSGDQQRAAAVAQDNGGFFYVKSNEASILLFEILNMERVLYPASEKKSICDIVKRKDVIKSLHLRVTYLDDANFMRFCQPNVQDRSKICTIHANCCYDTDSKVNNLKLLLEDWRNITTQKNNSIRGLSPLWRSRSKCKGTFSV